jgi:hypothetical protein
MLVVATAIRARNRHRGLWHELEVSICGAAKRAPFGLASRCHDVSKVPQKAQRRRRLELPPFNVELKRPHSKGNIHRKV